MLKSSKTQITLIKKTLVYWPITTEKTFYENQAILEAKEKRGTRRCLQKEIKLLFRKKSISKELNCSRYRQLNVDVNLNTLGSTKKEGL